MTRPLVTLECLDRHPRIGWITCAMPFGHDGPHANSTKPNARRWDDTGEWKASA